MRKSVVLPRFIRPGLAARPRRSPPVVSAPMMALVADVALDAFTDIAPDLQLSGGPRATFATSGYFHSYYGVNEAQSAASGPAL